MASRRPQVVVPWSHRLSFLKGEISNQEFFAVLGPNL
jgi:hypothetical protein